VSCYLLYLERSERDTQRAHDQEYPQAENDDLIGSIEQARRDSKSGSNDCVGHAG
jgi:hypothetical protein